MSDSEDRIDIYVDDPERPVPSPAPVTRPPVGESTYTKRPASVLPWIVVAALVGFLAWTYWPHNGILPTPDNDPITTGGPAVLIAVDGDRMDNLEVGQAQVAISTKIQTWCEQHNVVYRRYDVEADLSTEEDFVQEMMEGAKEGQPPNVVIVDENGKGIAIDIPNSVDAMIKQLEEFFK